MANEPTFTIIGNLTDAPELRFTASGVAVANVTVASTPRNFDKNSNEWVDGETLFMRGSLWRDAAENAAQSLNKGARVIATGFLKQRSYETNEGEKRTVVELDIQEIGPSLRYATANVVKVNNNNGNQGGNIGAASQQSRGQQGGGNQGGYNNGGQQNRGQQGNDFVPSNYNDVPF